MMGTSVPFATPRVLSFSPVVMFCDCVGRAIITDSLFGLFSVHRTFNVPFLIFSRVEEKPVDWLSG